MKRVIIGLVIALGLCIACAKPPAQKLNDVKQKVERVSQDGITDPNFDKLVKELNDEIALQRSMFFKTYKRTNELCDEILRYTPQPHPRMAEALYSPYKFCPYCGHKLQGP